MLLLLASLAFAGRVERVAELQAAGAHAEVVESVAKWEKAGSLGDEAAALLAARDRSALALARAANTVAAFAEFRRNYPTSALLQEVTEEEWRVAFGAAQSEGTSASMKAFIDAYPRSTLRDQAISQEAGFAYQEAVAAGTPDAIATFTRSHPESPYAATAWESLAARTPGIHLRLADGLPRALDPLPVVDGKIAFPQFSVVAPARPIVAVNLPGTGRGETSEWWTLRAVDAEGRLDAVAPVARMFEKTTGVRLDTLRLEALPGAHAARVASTAEPLVIPGACEGKARFAFVLTSDAGQTAFPFAVDCRATLPEDAATPLFLTAFALAEDGDLAGATALWDQAVALPGGSRLVASLAATHPDPKDALLTRRPSLGDVLVWDGAATVWWHLGPDGSVELARRDGLWVADGQRLWRWESAVEPWSVPASGGCKAASGERTNAALLDRVSGERVDVPFLGEGRGGAITPRQAGAGAIAVVEESPNAGCARASDPLPRTVRLPGERATALAPDWAAAVVTGAPGHSVVSLSPWKLYAAFTAE